jgi:hypothetical protein
MSVPTVALRTAARRRYWRYFSCSDAIRCKAKRLISKKQHQEESMKRQLFPIAMFAVLTCAGLEAQSSTLQANIPFDFSMGKTAMPAGEYTITCSNSVLTIREVGGKHVAMTLTNPTRTTPGSRHEQPEKASLLFNRYGDEYFLTGVWNPYLQEGRVLPESPRQKELASRLKPTDATAIALSKK